MSSRRTGVSQPMSDDVDKTWRWADADGVQHVASQWDLVASLASGALPPYTLVWRAGWVTWLPACQVLELHPAVGPDHAEQPVDPGLDPSAVSPPRPPVELYRSYHQQPSPPFLDESQTFGGAIRRDVLPTIADDTTGPSSGTLRPPGAVPPPPRHLPPAPFWSRHPRDTLNELATPIATPMPDFYRGLTPTPASGDVSPRSSEPTAQENVPSATPAPQRRKRPYVLAGAGLGLIGASALGVALTRSNHADQPTANVAVSATPSAARVPRPPCTMVQRPVRLAAAVTPTVPPYAMANDQGLLLGLASTKTEATGLSVQLESLQATTVFSERTRRPVAGVVPIASNPARFAVDTARDDTRALRTIAANVPIRVAAYRGALAREVNGRWQALWPLAEPRITEPRVASTARGHALTIRAGDQRGRILIGWLAPNGARQSRLEEISRSDALVGVPVVSADERAVVVAFAARADETSPWRIQLALAGQGELPKAVSKTITATRADRSAISPFLAPAPHGRWLLQWTEGAAGNYHVRIQLLSSALAPIGESLQVSPETANAGQGLVFTSSERSVSFYLVNQGSTHELWATRISCP